MEHSFLSQDHIIELLNQIITFTRLRRILLNDNLTQMDRKGFIPQDLPVRDFSCIMESALCDHIQHQRLIFRDTKTIRFGCNGQLNLEKVADEQAQRLLKTSPEQYQLYIHKKISENDLNEEVAMKLRSGHRSYCQTGSPVDQIPSPKRMGSLHRRIPTS